MAGSTGYLKPEFKRTSRPAFTVDGVEWLSHRVGIGRYALFTADGRASVQSNYSGNSYSAYADGLTLGKLYRTEKAACKVAAKALKKAPKQTELPREGTTYRTKCLRGRVSYSPGWSASMPWATYIEGTAGRLCETLSDACIYFEGKGMELVI